RVRRWPRRAHRDRRAGRRLVARPGRVTVWRYGVKSAVVPAGYDSSTLTESGGQKQSMSYVVWSASVTVPSAAKLARLACAMHACGFVVSSAVPVVIAEK